MKNGFGWQFGPFEIIDKIGISFLEKKINKSKNNIPNLLKYIGENKFYQLEADQIKYFDFVSKNYMPTCKDKFLKIRFVIIFKKFCNNFNAYNFCF